MKTREEIWKLVFDTIIFDGVCVGFERDRAMREVFAVIASVAMEWAEFYSVSAMERHEAGDTQSAYRDETLGFAFEEFSKLFQPGSESVD